jgi:hypothetical protein
LIWRALRKELIAEEDEPATDYRFELSSSPRTLKALFKALLRLSFELIAEEDELNSKLLYEALRH